ncbi:Bug family tripartite tricarboxylate transporter substrate binding protein [Salinarimonas sp. NSM]|uniref:Bug family tripartite tricarboxylate transporter substrate binding protein n=1 Tax=Salinarimonas sp. NSM TaxID=3458003 RepID=UPI0040352A1A
MWKSILAAGLAAGAIAVASAPAQAEGWPTQPIRLITASAASGNAFVSAQIVAAELEKRLGQRIVLEAMPQSSGMVATELVSDAEPDGHTLLVGTSSQLVFNIALFPDMPVDLSETLRGVAMINSVPLVLVVNPDDPAQTMEDYVAALKAEPGAFQYGSGPVGTTTHVTGLRWANAVGVEVEHVPYEAGSDARRDVVAGRLSHMFDVAVTAIPQIEAGAVRPLAITSLARSGALPEVPTVAELGFPGFEAATWNTIAAPSGTPDAIVERLNAEVAAVMETPAVREQLLALGADLVPPRTPAEIDAFYAEQRETWIPLVREAVGTGG